MKRILSGTLIASFALTSSLAGAAGKYTKKEAEITANQTSLTKPVQHTKDEKKKPTITADDVFGGVGEKVKSVTDQQIRVLQRLIDNTNDTDPEKPDLLFRMAELYNEQYRYYDFRARELDEKIFNAGNAGNQGLANQLKGQQADYQKKSQTWLLASAKAYLEVADHPDKYGSYKRMDEVLFYLAYMLNQVKKEDAARKYFKRLIKDYPKSRFIPYAFLAFGDYYFDNKQLEDALKFYDRVMQFPESPIYGYAKYKEGWVYYNLGDFKQALATFVSVIELSEKGGAGAGTNKANKIALAKEAKKDSVRAYARIGTPDKAYEFFKRIGGNYAMTMMEQLGDLYNAQGQFADSIKVYRNLMALDVNSPKLCSWEWEVMKNTLSMTGSRATPDSVKELQRMGAVYEKVKDAKGLKKEQLEECHDNTANVLGELATVWHKEATKTNNNDTLALAQYLYKEYLTRFPKAKDVYQMTFYYAELLFKLGANGDNNSYCNAAPVYTKVVELQPAPTAKYLKESAYAAVISWKNCLAVDESGEAARADMINKRKQLKEEGGKGKKEAKGEEKEPEVLPPQPIGPNKQKMLAAYETYVKYVPDSPELPNIKYNKARIYYEANHFDEAIPLFRDIADHHQNSDLAYYSTVLLYDCLSFKKKYDDLQAALDQYCPMYAEKDPTVKGQCTTLRSGLTRKRIEIAQEKGLFKEVAKMYMQMAEENPNYDKIDEVYYNAAVNYERAHLLGLAINAREILLKAKPDSTLAKKAIYQIGRNYADVAAYERAADMFEQFAEKFPGEKEAPVALNSATFYRRGLGENDKAIKDVALFVKDYGGRHEFIDQAAGVAFDEAQIYEAQKDNGKLMKHFQDYLKSWASKGGVDRQVIAHVKMGEILWNQSCPLPDGGVNGACIEIKRERAGGAARVAEKQAKANKGKKGKKKKGANLPAQCGPETKSKIVVHDRGPAKLKEAMGHFAEAMKLYKGGAAAKSVPGKDEATRDARAGLMAFYAAEARFKEGDVEYEKFLKMQIPDKLDFSPAPPGSSPAKEKAAKKKVEENQKKFKTWLTNKTKQLDVAQKIYQNVIQSRQAHWVIAAAARIGQVYQDFSGQLYTAPVPKAGSAPPGYPQEEFDQFFHDAYCDAMVDVAEPLETKAVDALAVCLNKSTDLSFYDEWSQLCEAELNQLKPVEYPLPTEIRAQPGYNTLVEMDRAPVQPLETK
jgi:tetratricopeptide (TPR) repeat protein